MPYVSQAQRRWAHTKSAKRKGFPTAEFDKASKGKKLPARAKTKSKSRTKSKSKGSRKRTKR